MLKHWAIIAHPSGMRNNSSGIGAPALRGSIHDFRAELELWARPSLTCVMSLTCRSPQAKLQHTLKSLSQLRAEEAEEAALSRVSGIHRDIGGRTSTSAHAFTLIELLVV